MKKAISALLTSVLAVAPAAWGAYVAPDEALARVGADRTLAPAIGAEAPASFTLSATVGNLYVFEGRGGYLVLPDDDAVPALLGYSTGSKFDADVNPNLAYWLESLNSEIDYIKSMPAVPVLRQPRADREAVPPMLLTLWNQETPYNNDCPMDGNARSVTGCVATAMAQVLKYHEWPVQGTGSYSYTWNGTQLTFDYGSTIFDWDLMDDDYDSSSTAESSAEVAKLMYACGVSVDMNYSSESSGAQSAKIPAALFNHFGYDRSAWLAQRNAYGLAEWEDLIYTELQEGRPVLYGGQGSGGGHEFVCDGYDGAGYYHFNWGWGGMSDGYFLLTALNPGSLGTGGGAGGFNYDQDAVISLKPGSGSDDYTYVMYNIKDFAAESPSYTLGAYAYFTGGFFNASPVDIESPQGGVKIQSVADGSAVYCESLMQWGALPVSSYYGRMAIRVPSNLAQGEYIVTPAYRIAGGEWHDMHSYITVNGRLNATFDGSKVVFSIPERAAVTVTDVVTKTTLYMSRAMPMSFTVNNPSDEEYIGEIVPTLFDADGTRVFTSDPEPVDIAAGGSVTFDDVAVNFKYYYTQTPQPGSYKLAFCDGNNKILSELIDVTLQTAPTQSTYEVTGFSLVSATPVSDKSAVKFSVGFKCTRGYVSGSPEIYVFPYVAGQSVSSVYGTSLPAYYLAEGESETKEVSLNLSSLDNGKYFAVLYYNGKQATNTQIVFELTNPTTGIGEAAITAPDDEEIYDLSGVRRERPLPAGLYIINGVKTIVR